MKYLSLKQPVAVYGRLVYPDAGVLMLDDVVEAQRILDAGQATDVTAEFDALAAAATPEPAPVPEQSAAEQAAATQVAADEAKLAADQVALAAAPMPPA